MCCLVSCAIFSLWRVVVVFRVLFAMRCELCAVCDLLNGIGCVVRRMQCVMGSTWCAVCDARFVRCKL